MCHRVYKQRVGYTCKLSPHVRSTPAHLIWYHEYASLSLLVYIPTVCVKECWFLVEIFTESQSVNPADFAALVDTVNRQAVEMVNLKQEVAGLHQQLANL